MESDEWKRILLSSAATHDWDEVLLAAAAALPLSCCSGAGILHKSIDDSITAAVRRAAACHLRGCTEVANSMLLHDAKYLPHDCPVLICGGAGTALGWLLSNANPRLILLDCEVLEPLLVRALKTAAVPWSSSLALPPHVDFANEDDDGRLRALLSVSSSDLPSSLPSSVSSSIVCVMQMGAAGPLAKHVQQWRAAVRALGTSSMRVRPAVVEVWAVLVQGWVAAKGIGSRRALSRLLTPSPPPQAKDVVGEAAEEAVQAWMEPLRLAMQQAADPRVPLSLHSWEHIRLCTPTRLMRWSPTAEPATEAEMETMPMEAQGEATVDGVADAIVVWTEVCEDGDDDEEGEADHEASQSEQQQQQQPARRGRWVSRGPSCDLDAPSSHPPVLASRHRTPACLAEPQLGCCILPRRVRRGQSFKIDAKLGPAGVCAITFKLADENVVEEVDAAASAARVPSVASPLPAAPPLPATSSLPAPSPLGPPLPSWTAWMINDVERARAYEHALNSAMR